MLENEKKIVLSRLRTNNLYIFVVILFKMATQLQRNVQRIDIFLFYQRPPIPFGGTCQSKDTKNRTKEIVHTVNVQVFEVVFFPDKRLSPAPGSLRVYPVLHQVVAILSFIHVSPARLRIRMIGRIKASPSPTQQNLVLRRNCAEHVKCKLNAD